MVRGSVLHIHSVEDTQTHLSMLAMHHNVALRVSLALADPAPTFNG